MAVETPFLVEPFMKAGTRAFNDKSGALQSDPKNIQNTNWEKGIENNETLDSSQVSAPAYVLAKAARVQQQHGVAPWAVGVDYPKGAISWHNEALHVATSAHTATRANAPGQSGAPWVRSDARTTAIEATNIGKTGNQPIFKFTANDWKDRPIGWHGMIGPGSAGSPDTVNWFYLEKIGNRNVANGHYWRAYPIGSNSYFYVGYNDNPATQNGGLPYWEKYESANKKVYVGNPPGAFETLGGAHTAATNNNAPGKLHDVLTIPITGRYLVIGQAEMQAWSFSPANQAFLAHWVANIPAGKTGGHIFGLNASNSSNHHTTVTNVVVCQIAAGEILKAQVVPNIFKTVQIHCRFKITALKIGD